MPYLPSKPDDDEQQQQPTLSGGGQTAPMGGAPAPAQSSAPAPTGGPAQSSQPAQQNANRSGRFTNLQNFLGANQQIGGQVKTAGASSTGKAQDLFNTAANPVRNATFTANTTWQTPFNSITASAPAAPTTPAYQPPSGSGQGIMRMSGGSTGGSVSSPVGLNNGGGVGNSTALADLTAMLNQQYAGPRDVNYDASTDKNVESATNLGNARTAGKELAVGPYSAGANRFDASLFGSSGEVKGVQDALNTQIGKFKTDTAKEKADLLNRVASFDTAAGNARETVRSGLEGAGNDLLSGLTGKADNLNQQSGNDFASGIIRDPTTGQVVQAPGGQMRGAWEGAQPGSASVGNLGSADDFAKFKALGQLLNNPDFSGLTDTGDYVGGRYTTTFDPNSAPDTMVTPMEQKKLTPAAKPGELNSLRTDQTLAYQKYIDQGMTHEQALAYASLT